MARCLLLALLMTIPAVSVSAQRTPPDSLVEGAVVSLPDTMRPHATVLAVDANGDAVVVRSGSGPMICVADNPATDGFHSACYHKELEPFMARGRELKQQGKDRDEIVEIREREIESGDLSMPATPAALYSVTGEEGCYDGAAGTLCDAVRLYVVYVPFATAESTGLSTTATRGSPWLMNPGKPWAHIMMIPE